jgi:LruC domain-containing protein
MKKSLPAVVALIASLAACSKNNMHSNNGGGDTTAHITKVAPDGFNYATSQNVSVNVRLLAPDNTPISGVPVHFYKTTDNTSDSNALFTAVTDAGGYATGIVALAQTIDTLYIDAQYTGLMRFAKGYLTGTNLTATIGGPDGYSGNIAVNNFRARTVHEGIPVNSGMQSTVIASMGTTDSYGRPNYLVSPGDVISSSLLTTVNASLPETKDLRVTHPQYLQSSATGNVIITQNADVWMTFVSEGAGYDNSIGYYTYPTNSPPSSTADIDSIHVILPNASLSGSGGSMRAGDKVKLGTFSAGTTIGFVLFSNGWAGSNKVSSTAYRFFSDPGLNPETDATVRKHSVLLNDATDNLYLVGFEDMLRTNSSCDHDFNDVVFYTTANPIAAISPVGVQPVDSPKDSDGDGVSDVFDQFPTDATRAYINYYPSQTTYSTLAFEDNWPNKGDYDMNDVVVSYQYQYISNAQNNVVEMYGNFAVAAAGATFKNGFGVQFPFSPSVVSSVTGTHLKDGYIKTTSSGLEASQSKAVIIPFDNYSDLIQNPGGAYFINTDPSMAKVTGDTAKVHIVFTSAISTSTLGTAPFNPFIISNERRGYEIHLPNYVPTDLVNTALFGTADDNSKPSSGLYYVTKENWPWGISFPQQFSYPTERDTISKGYLHFLDWSGSGGTTYTDWYSNTASGYRNNTYIYLK